MEVIKFSLNKQKISLIDCPIIASNSKDYLYASFELESDDWVKPIIAIFISEEKVPFSVTLDDDNMCKVPWEVLQYGNKVEVSAVCGDLHTATSVAFSFENSGYRNGNEPLEPSSTIWSELSKKIEGKQDKLIAGDGTKIEDNVISVTGGAEGTNGAKLGLQVFETYPYEWMYAIKDIRVTDGRAIAIGYIKRTHSKNLIALYLVENGALTTVQLYANADSDITGYATYSNSAKTITMAVNWDEIPYDTEVQFNNKYVLCSEWCYGGTRLNYLINKVKGDAVSNFESTGKADKIVSNVQIVGMNHTDARLLISNFNRHYNGDDTDLLYIYTTDDTGSTANLIKGVRVTEETGTITVDLSKVVSGAIIRFDYDFSGIADGTRLQGTGTGFLVKKNCYNLETVEEKIPIDFGFFERFAVIGDSYSSGEIYVADASQSKGYTVADYYQKSWGQILARKYGASCINLSVGGLTTRTWLTNSHGLVKMLAEKPQELYLCALGINDEISLGTSYLGTIEDITNYKSYSDYSDTFYGNYGKIIEQIKTHAPKSKIVLMSMAYLYNATEDSFTMAIKNIANHYNIPFINIKDDAFYAKNSIYKTGQSYNHPTAPLYAGMAQANERLFCRCVVDNYDYFKDFIG
jgi:lysophospholipase L1-like esterase